MKTKVALRLRFGLLLSLYGAILPWACAGEAPAALSNNSAGLEGRTISDVSIVGNRTSSYFLASKIRLHKGKPFHQADLEATRKNLYAMRLFKKVEITPKLNADGTVDVAILARDGWYAVPVPFAFSGAGGSGISLDLLERNYLAQNESMLIGGSQSGQGQSAGLGGASGRWSGNSMFSQAAFTQIRFADGGANVSNMLGANTLSDPGRYGAVASSYQKEVREGSGAIQFAALPEVRVGLGFTGSRVGYAAPAPGVPTDAGWQNWGEASLSFGNASHGGVNGLSDSVGAVFGLGLADLDERVRSLRGPEFTWGSSLAADVGSPLLGSDYDFTRYRAEGGAKLEFSERHVIEFKTTAAEGFDLPFTQEIATDRMLGLQGSYVREFLGERGVGGSLSGVYYFRRNHRGVLALEAFAETASVWGDGAGGRQSGVGGSLYYSFWRFPLPLGLGYTYSIPDHDGEISLAVGARFGN